MKNAQTERKQRKSKAKKKMKKKSKKKPNTKGKNRVKKVKKKMVKKKRKFNSRPEKPKKETSGTQSKVKGESEAGRVGETNSAYDFQNTKKIDVSYVTEAELFVFKSYLPSQKRFLLNG